MRVSTSTSKKKTVSRSEDQTAEENCWTVKGTGGEEDRGGDKQPLQPSKVNTRKRSSTELGRNQVDGCGVPGGQKW